MWELFKEASFGFKLQMIWFGVMIIFGAFIGLSYLVGDLEVKESPPKVVIDYEQMYKNCMESIKDYDDVRYADASESCAMIGSSDAK